MTENTKSKNINKSTFSLYSPCYRIVPLLGNKTNGQHHFQGLMPPGHMQMGDSQLRISLPRPAAVRAPEGVSFAQLASPVTVGVAVAAVISKQQTVCDEAEDSPHQGWWSMQHIRMCRDGCQIYCRDHYVQNLCKGQR